MENFEFTDKFVSRHIGPNQEEAAEMLNVIGADSIGTLMNETIPEGIRLKKELELPEPLSEYAFLKKLKSIAASNKVFKSYIGMGYYNTILPPVIQRNVLENPGWYTQYTPYQAEISQGRLEALINYQTMVAEMTGLPIANASLLDEATAAAEAMTMLYAQRKNRNASTFFVSEECLPQTIDVLITRSAPLGINLKVGNHAEVELNGDIFAALLQYPSRNGEVYDYSSFIQKAHDSNIFVVMAADLMSLALLSSPGELGADVAVGNTQRFGVPMGYGGPHAAYFATKEDFKRFMPGRIIGISIDAKGNKAYRMALQTREQHIRREKATSNICTAQVLLAIMAGMYAVYHGPKGIKAIAERIHNLTALLEAGLNKLGYIQLNEYYFDTLRVDVSSQANIETLKKLALEAGMNFNYIDGQTVSISIDQAADFEDVKNILSVFAQASGKDVILNYDALSAKVQSRRPSTLERKSEYLQEKVFNSYHSETEMMRYIKSLEKKDLSLTTAMIPLGSCTMKLNAAAEMLGITWEEFSSIHPFAPENQAKGYRQIIEELENYLAEITGFAGVSLQPNSGAQGEYSGLTVIRNYHLSRGDEKRNVVVIPSSAHGTNPASAVMAGMKVVVTGCDNQGNIDLQDLRKKIEEHKDNLAALMVTYPSTHGVFEEEIKEICEAVHKAGGLVYMDGANMNAQVGHTSPTAIGADVCHLNLHKTFAIPHGGGGPGVGPIACTEELKPFLPGHPVVDPSGNNNHAVAAAPWGSANVLIISYAYISMMGTKGLKMATEAAILNANYLKARLEPYYKVLYTGKQGRVAHELIFDMRQFKASAGIEVEDIAKRLMDYGFHAPTVSFPVPGTLMVEPTESESKYELDRFCEAMIMIHQEIKDIEQGMADKTDNLLKNAPHTALEVASDSWSHPYSRQSAAFPTEWTVNNKFWPAVARVNNAYGDRNLVCTCEPLSSYAAESVL